MRGKSAAAKKGLRVRSFLNEKSCKRSPLGDTIEAKEGIGLDKIVLMFELIGTASFSVSGALCAIAKKLDIFGVLFCGIVTALGGGVFRDLLLGQTPPTMFTDYIYVVAAALAALLTFIIVSVVHKRSSRPIDERGVLTFINYLLDAVGLAVFTVVGVNVAMACGFENNPFFVISLGMTTGCFGGVFRDVLTAEIPVIFTKRIYAVASALGGAVYWALWHYEVLAAAVAMTVGMAVIFAVRLMAIIFKWNLPKAA